MQMSLYYVSPLTNLPAPKELLRLIFNNLTVASAVSLSLACVTTDLFHYQALVLGSAKVDDRKGRKSSIQDFLKQQIRRSIPEQRYLGRPLLVVVYPQIPRPPIGFLKDDKILCQVE